MSGLEREAKRASEAAPEKPIIKEGYNGAVVPPLAAGPGGGSREVRGAALSSSHEEGPGVVVTVIYYLGTPREASRK